jgi:hypothetical protein
MTVPAGFALPELSAYDPPAAGEGSLDPMGVAALSDRLADRLVPGVRARMSRVRFVTAIAVGALACETLGDELPADGISTPAICFEWLVVEGFVRRLPAGRVPPGIPGSQKARGVVSRGERLSAATYLKGPSVFGFNGVYKPFAVDAGVVGSGLEPGPRAAELVRAWELDQGFGGFVEEVPGSEGGRLRTQLRDQVRAALREGRCGVNPQGWLFGHLANSLHPENARSAERAALRSLLVDGPHESRRELALLVAEVRDDLFEAQYLEAVRPRCSGALGAVVDAVTAYERFAARVDAAFRTLCAVSHGMGSQPLTAGHAAAHPMVVRCAGELPASYRLAAELMAAVGADAGLEERLGDFAIPRPPADLVELLFEHHERVQALKPPGGRRPWFEPVRSGRVVRRPYGEPLPPELGPWFVHPVRVAALRRFVLETAR